MRDEHDRLAAAPAEVRLDGPRVLHDGYRRLESWTVGLQAGARGLLEQRREVLRAGACIGVIPVDLKRDEVVLIRQFRLPAHLATGLGDLVEIVAGRVEPGEEIAAAARREVMEETGLEAKRLVELFAFLPTPGIVEEHATLFLAAVDAGSLPEEAGAEAEHEHTRPFAVPIDEAIASLEDRRAKNAYLALALQWLALNRSRLAALLDEAPAEA